MDYEDRVRQLEAEGLCTSDAQGVADGEQQPAAAATAAIDSPARRLQAWADVCTGGAMNVLELDGVRWSWTRDPRLQRNGAALGRVYAIRRGENARGMGGYKIDADGRVLKLPAALRAALPGGMDAEASTDAETHQEAP